MDRVTILEPTVTALKTFDKGNGLVMHGMKASESTYAGFGEAYFSTIDFNQFSGWKLHRKMMLNIVVPKGQIRFAVLESGRCSSLHQIEPLMNTVIGEKNFARITIPPGFWVAFKGVGLGTNILLNIANIEHNPNEATTQTNDYFKVKNFNT